MQIRFKRALYICPLLLLMSMAGCKKFLEPEAPKTEVPAAAVFSNDENALAAVSGVYATMMNQGTFGGKITILTGLSSDELTYLSPGTDYDLFQNNTLLPDASEVQAFWDNLYAIIYGCNSIIENARASTGMSDAFKRQATGEALFLRAYCHFYLVNLFGDVPLITTADVTQTAFAPRTAAAAVYEQIIADLKTAMSTLPGDYAFAGGKRTRANKWAAAALLARAYLYTRDWPNAELLATDVIEKGGYALMPAANIDKVFKTASSEAILQLSYTLGNTAEGDAFLNIFYSFDYFIYYLRSELLGSFAAGDLRKDNWVLSATYTRGGVTGTYNTPYKYKLTSSGANNEERYILLRLAEQYLIRAEARAQQENIMGAREDINVIRNRAGLNNTTAANKPTLLAAVEQERRTELFCEWGHRWFDLKRWPSLTAAGKTRADDVLGDLKSTWTPTASLYPLPLNAITNNPKLTQNEGYQ